jgi:hypothetical protein
MKGFQEHGQYVTRQIAQEKMHLKPKNLLTTTYYQAFCINSNATEEKQI